MTSERRHIEECYLKPCVLEDTNGERIAFYSLAKITCSMHLHTNAGAMAAGDVTIGVHSVEDGYNIPRDKFTIPLKEHNRLIEERYLVLSPPRRRGR